MIQRFLPSRLQTRLLLSFGLLVLLTASLANGASLALYGHQLESDARASMAGQAMTLSNVLTEAAGDEAIPIDRLSGLIFTDSRLRRSQQPLNLVDARGKALASISPSFLGRGQGRGPRDASPTLRRPFLEESLQLPPTEPDANGQPTVAEIRMENGFFLLYTTVLLPVAIVPDEDWMRLVGPDAQAPLYLAIVRPKAELSGLWRSLLPSVVQVGLVALALSMLVAWVLARSITHPVAALTEASERMAAGDYSVSVREADRPDELGRLAQSFNSMARAVAEAHRRQREFVVNVGHDLRTPLTTIRGFADALTDGTARTDAQRDRALQAISSAGDRMVDLVESLIDLARLEGQAAGLQLRQMPVSELLEEVIRSQQAAADLRHVRLEIEASAQQMVHVDMDWMLRALGNLVENAIRHGPAGGRVLLRATPARLPDGREAVQIEVHDEGEGIREEDLPRVFERFYRGDAARKAGGSGLGLAIAREIVEVHAGQISAGPSPSGGACFELRIPVDIGAGMA